MTDPHELVHQVFFGWTYNQPTSKLDIRAWSPDIKAKRWSARLKDHLRLQGVNKPPHALSYLAFDDGTVAILRRVLGGYTDGRNNSHALIGPAHVLTVSVALSLEDWPDWKDEAPQNQWMTTYTASSFAGFTDDALDDQMRPPAAQCEQVIGTVLARLLDKPAAPLTIIGCPPQYRLPMVWALRAAADGYLRRNAGVTRRWSFSSHEARHDDAIERLPEIVFLPAPPEGTGVANRTIVDLTPGREQPPSANSALATSLVARLFHKTTQRDPVYEPHPQPYQPPQQQLTLHNARTLGEFLVALENLETTVSGSQRRRELRDTLDVDTMNKITHFVEHTARKELTARVMTVAYGSQCADLHHTDGLAHATDQIAKCESDYLARSLSAAAPPNSKNQVTAAAYHRWVTLDRPPAIPPLTRKTTPDRRPPAPKNTTPKNATLVRVLTALVLTFIIGILLGMLIGGSTPPAASTTPPPETTTTTPPTTPQATVPGPRSATLPSVGRVALEPSDKERVYSFVQLGATYYPQAPCHNIRQNTYQCVRTSSPPDSPPHEPALVAIIVPATQLAGLEELAAQHQPTLSREGWGDTKIVRG